jgi:ribonuclease BN (tRNA processing enzyme)
VSAIACTEFIEGEAMARLIRAGRTVRRLLIWIIAVELLFPAVALAQAPCKIVPLAVQVLGSGGPYATGGRASSGYIVWRNGRAIVLVDAGGGTFTRFGESGARVADLTLIAISHLHPDHVSDLPALLWLSEQSRREPLRIVGPSGDGHYPSFDVFLTRLFDSDQGAFAFMSGTLGQGGLGVRLDISVVNAKATVAQPVLASGALRVTALGVPHGDAPALAYRIEADGRSIVFGSDQTGANPGFVAFASGADMLVLHLSLAELTRAPLTGLHALPSKVGEMAQAAQAKHLVLSHLTKAPPGANNADQFSASNLHAAVAEVRKYFTGPIDVATDLKCMPVP